MVMQSDHDTQPGFRGRLRGLWRRLRTDAGPLYGAVRAAVRRRR
jgi:hypothetical protein